MSHSHEQCHGCRFRERPCRGSCLCTIDGVDVGQHLRLNQCPLGRFNSSAPGLPLLRRGVRVFSHRAIAVSPAPGDAVKTVLKKLGYSATGGCGCGCMRKKMNDWGWLGCLRHRQEILNWFTQQARQQGISVDRPALWPLLQAAWREQQRRR